MTTKEVFEFTAKVRRFHYYEKIWQQKKKKGLNCLHEPGNAFHVYGIKTVVGNGVTVGHLP